MKKDITTLEQSFVQLSDEEPDLTIMEGIVVVWGLAHQYCCTNGIFIYNIWQVHSWQQKREGKWWVLNEYNVMSLLEENKCKWNGGSIWWAVKGVTEKTVDESISEAREWQDTVMWKV